MDIRGLIAAPLTGYRADGAINLEMISSYAALLAASGVCGAFVNGSTGEGLSLSGTERRALAEAWRSAAPPGFLTIIHVGHCSQEESKDLSRHAAAIGADAVAEIGPIYYKPASVAALVDYTAATAAAAPKLPYFYYHIPALSGVNLPMSEYLPAAKRSIPNLAGLKFTSPDLDDFFACQAAAAGYSVLFGSDELLLEALKRGAHGAVGSSYNAFAPLYTSLWEAFEQGDLEEAERLQALSREAIRLMQESGAYFSALKHLMNRFGLGLSGMRRPLPELSASAASALDSALDAAGLFEYSMMAKPVRS